MMLVFAASSTPLQFNIAKFQQMPGVLSIKSAQLQAIEEVTELAPPISSTSSSSNDSTAIIAGVVGGVGGAVLVIGAAMLLMRRLVTVRATELADTKLSLADLKADLAPEA